MLSVTDKGEPVRDGIKLHRLKQLLRVMMDNQGNGVVNIKTVCTCPVLLLKVVSAPVQNAHVCLVPG